jgi:DegV family protein with EDD domain
MQSAVLAKQMMLEKYPDARITVIDSMINTVLQGIYVLEAVRLQQAGATYQAAVDRLLEIRPSGRIFFTIGSMDYLQKGGRIGRLAGKVATVLGVRPMIVLREGEIFPAGLARSREGSMEKVLTLLQGYLEETRRPARDFSICIGYGYSREEAERFRARVMQRFSLTQEQVPLYQIGATIAVHTGPYPIGMGIVERACPENRN